MWEFAGSFSLIITRLTSPPFHDEAFGFVIGAGGSGGRCFATDIDCRHGMFFGLVSAFDCCLSAMGVGSAAALGFEGPMDGGNGLRGESSNFCELRLTPGPLGEVLRRVRGFCGGSA